MVLHWPCAALLATSTPSARLPAAPPPRAAVNLLAQLDYFEGHHHCLLSMEQGMLVLHPDVLLSGAGGRAAGLRRRHRGRRRGAAHAGFGGALA